jgi:thiol-disulfide isomerase/thioredoxin
MIGRRGGLAAAIVLGLGCAHGRPGAGQVGAWVGSLPPALVQGGELDVRRLEGRVVLVTFVATSCFPCLADLVTLKKLAREYDARGFANVLVGLDLDGLKVLRPFAETFELELPLLVGDDALRAGQTPFGHLRELPTRVLFGRDGSPVVGFTGVARYQDLARLVETELARPPP